MDIDYLTGVSFTLPKNVTLTSSSGVFGTQPVPEPEAWVAMATGMLGVLRRRRR